MGGTKIVVLQLKELIKTAIFIIIGIGLIVLLIYMFIPKEEKETALYNPGTYSSEIILHNNPVSIEVTVNENEIVDIKMLNMNQTQEVFYPLFDTALEQIQQDIISNQSTDINPSTDISVTGQILIDAVDNALEQAKIE